MRVLGIESSCDETAAAVVSDDGVLSDVVWSQEVHAAYGGVVPELAARAHLERIVPVVRAALAAADVDRPDAVAVTAGPGLVGALLVGMSFARAAAVGWGVPVVAVNHLEGHLLSPLLERPAPPFPYLSLVVSGGHTTLYRVDGVGRYATLHETLDDAAGEAYDKVARMLDLGYPGGPEVDRLAALGDPLAVPLPRPLPAAGGWSFSGLKTAVRAVVRAGANRPEDVCAGFQAAVIDCLLARVNQEVDRTGIEHVAIAGGVAANRGLRARLAALPIATYAPPPGRCTDNAAMIGLTGLVRLNAGLESASFEARPSWEVH